MDRGILLQNTFRDRAGMKTLGLQDLPLKANLEAWDLKLEGYKVTRITQREDVMRVTLENQKTGKGAVVRCVLSTGQTKIKKYTIPCH
jgi:hypothetical protein